MGSFSFYQNRECEFFPCHKGVKEADFNCLFCYCPLYALGEDCGGSFRYTQNGIKDCSGCTRPHIQSNYSRILSGLEKVMELAKKPDQAQEKP